MLDAVKAGQKRLPRIEDLQMRRAGDVMRVADVDDGARARQRQAKVDLQRGRALLDVPLGKPSRLVGIARDDGIVRIGGMVAVDMRPAREDPRPLQPIVRDHLPKSRELVVPLAGIAERRHAMTELTQRQSGIVLDVKVQIDEARDDGVARTDPAARRPPALA